MTSTAMLFEPGLGRDLRLQHIVDCCCLVRTSVVMAHEDEQIIDMVPTL